MYAIGELSIKVFSTLFLAKSSIPIPIRITILRCVSFGTTGVTVNRTCAVIWLGTVSTAYGFGAPAQRLVMLLIFIETSSVYRIIKRRITTSVRCRLLITMFARCTSVRGKSLYVYILSRGLCLVLLLELVVLVCFHLS